MMPHTVHLGVSTGITLLENNLAAQIKSLKTPFNSAIHHKKIMKFQRQGGSPQHCFYIKQQKQKFPKTKKSK